jgi:enterobacterial common antigen flippase
MQIVKSRLQWLLTGRDGPATAFQTLLSRVFIIVVNIATGIITARGLGPVGRGEQAAMILWPGFLASMLTLGLPSAFVYNVKRSPEARERLLTAALLLASGLGLLAAAIGVVGVPYWLSKYSPTIITYAQWLMLTAPLAMLQLVCYAALESMEDVTGANNIRLLFPLSSLAVLLGLLITKTLNPLTSSLAYIGNSLPIFIWSMAYLFQKMNLSWHRLWEASRDLVHYGVRSYGIDLLGALALQADQVFVVSLLPADDLGIYVVMMSLARILNVFQNSAVTVLFPAIAARNVRSVVRFTSQTARLSSAMTLATSVALMIAGPVLLRILYGPEYVSAIDVLRLLLIEAVLSGTILVLAQAFMALGRPGVVTLLQGLGLTLSLPLMLWLVPRYGLMGVAISLLTSTGIRLLFILACFPLVLRVAPPNLLVQMDDIRMLRKVKRQRSRSDEQGSDRQSLEASNAGDPNTDDE